MFLALVLHSVYYERARRLTASCAAMPTLFDGLPCPFITFLV